MPTFWTEIYQRHLSTTLPSRSNIQVYHDSAGAFVETGTHDWAPAWFRVYASMDWPTGFFRMKKTTSAR